MIDLPSLLFGAFVGVFAFTLLEICEQTKRIVQRARAWSWQNGYLYMIWSEAIVNFIFAIITILHFNNNIAGSLAFYFGTVTLWALQTQVLSQIIANRVSLIMMSRQRATWMRWCLFALILGVNVAVYIIWIPAYLPGATPERKRLNDIFEKFEKTFFLVVDLGLNGFFLYLVRYRLIAGGLPKYWALFKMNTVLIAVSTAMDAVLLGMLSLPDPYVYVQFAPLGYTIKLYIELVMTNLIAKVVSSDSATGQAVGGSSGYPSFPSFQPPLPMGHDRYGDKYGSTKSIFGDKSLFGDMMSIAPPASKFDTQSIHSTTMSYHTDVEGRYEAPGDEGFLDPVPETSIVKTVTTTIVSEDKNSPPPVPPIPAQCRSLAGTVKTHKSHRSLNSKNNRWSGSGYGDFNDFAPPVPSLAKSTTGTVKSHKSDKKRNRRSGGHEEGTSDPSPPPPPPPRKSFVGSIKNRKSLKSLKSHLKSGAREDLDNDPVPPPPLPGNEASASITRPRSRMAPHPLTSRFNKRQR